MKRILFVTFIAMILVSCATSKKGVKQAPVPPEGIVFKEIKNYGRFASIMLPVEGDGFSKQEGGSQNDDGEIVPTPIYRGSHIQRFSDIQKIAPKSKRLEGEAKKDINAALESMKGSSIINANFLKKENLVEQYSDVKIGNKTCKRVLLSSTFTKGDYSTVFYLLGYIVPHNETTAWIGRQKAKTDPKVFDSEVASLDKALKYMVETVQFR